MEIRLVQKKEIAPQFGRWTHEPDGTVTLLIRDDLPECVQAFLIEHEKGHEEDKRDGDFDGDGWIENEAEVNWWAICKHPLGGLLTALMYLAPYRLAYYWRRFREGK